MARWRSSRTVPGWYDTDTRMSTPVGNPQEQVANIDTNAGAGAGTEKVLSGLREDHGAGARRWPVWRSRRRIKAARRIWPRDWWGGGGAYDRTRARRGAGAQLAVRRGTAGESPTHANERCPKGAPALDMTPNEVAPSMEVAPST